MIRPSLRVNNSKAYIIPDTPTLYSKESFYPKTIREWNILPEEIVRATSLDIFKNRLTNHLCK